MLYIEIRAPKKIYPGQSIVIYFPDYSVYGHLYHFVKHESKSNIRFIHL